MKKYRLLFILACLFFAMNSFSQNKIVFNDARLKAGNQSAWKEKEYDEKGWVTVNLNRDWDSQGFAQHDGYAFYRMRFTLPLEMLENSLWKDSLLILMIRPDIRQPSIWNAFTK